MGSNVVSGSALAVILVTGNDTMIGRIEKTLNTFEEQTSFEKEMNKNLMAFDSFNACLSSSCILD